MKVQVQSVNFKVDHKLVDFIQQRMDKLEQFYDRIIDADVFLKVDNNPTRENKIVEVRMGVPGNDLMVKKECTSFEEATDLASDALRRQLDRHKAKVRGV